MLFVIKYPWTLATWVCYCFSMNTVDMQIPGIFPGICFVAKCTRKGFLFGMCSFMSLQCIRMCKLPVTKWTSVWFLSCMGSHVGIPVLFRSEIFLTFLTPVLFVLVYDLMTFEMISCCKLGITNLTLEFFASCMNWFPVWTWWQDNLIRKARGYGGSFWSIPGFLKRDQAWCDGWLV